MENKSLDEINNNSGKLTTVFLPYNIWELAKKNLIEFKSALIFGIRFLVADKNGFDYPDNSLSRKVLLLTSKISELSQEIEILKNPNREKIEKEAEEILKGSILNEDGK